MSFHHVFVKSISRMISLKIYWCDCKGWWCNISNSKEGRHFSVAELCRYVNNPSTLNKWKFTKTPFFIIERQFLEHKNPFSIFNLLNCPFYPYWNVVLQGLFSKLYSCPRRLLSNGKFIQGRFHPWKACSNLFFLFPIGNKHINQL